MKFVIFTILSFALLCSFTNVLSQDKTDTSYCPVKDLGDLIGKNKEEEKPPKNYYIFATPVIGSAPATGFVIGLAGQITFKGANPDDKYSVINANAQYTTKNQALFQIKNNLIMADNKLFMSGDLRLFIYSQPTYGLGTNALNAAEGGGIILGNDAVNPDSVAQQMNYNYFKFHQLAAYNFKGIFYLGGGINLDMYNKIKVEYPLLNGADTSFHTAYSLLHDNDTTKYGVNGLSVNGIIDTRDNQINATKGIFLNLAFNYNLKLSSKQNYSSILFGELRYFKSYRVRRHQHTLGFWLHTTFVVGGNMPYLTLPAIGWDQRSRSGRGYPQGAFRGESFAYGEFEYRFPITCNEFLGGVFFVNATTASNRDYDVPLFRYIQPAFGAGLRFLLDKTSRTNLVTDYGIGKKTSGFYLNAGETF